MFLVAVNVLLLIVGCFMEPNSAILVLAPLFYPIVMKMNINPIHFGIIMIYNLELGMLTPPLGLNLFVASGMTRFPLGRVVKAVIPFIIAMFITAGRLYLYPDLLHLASRSAVSRTNTVGGDLSLKLQNQTPPNLPLSGEA